MRMNDMTVHNNIYQYTYVKNNGNHLWGPLGFPRYIPKKDMLTGGTNRFFPNQVRQ